MTSSDDSSNQGGGASAAAAPPEGRYFPEGPWYEDVSQAPLDAESAAVVSWLDGEGWGTGQMRIDFSIEVMEADAGAPFRSFVPTDDFFEPDCDLEPVPVPAGGALEGEDGYACESDGDCHLIAVHRPTLRLFEMWRADIRGDDFFGGCLAVWDMSRRVPAERSRRAVHQRRRRRLSDRAASVQRGRGRGGGHRARDSIHPAELPDQVRRVRPPGDPRNTRCERPARSAALRRAAASSAATTRSTRCQTPPPAWWLERCSATACSWPTGGRSH